MPRFPIWREPLRVCCKFHECEPLAGGACRLPTEGVVAIYAHNLVYKLDWLNMVTKFDRKVISREDCFGAIVCENYLDGFLVAKADYKFAILFEYENATQALMTRRFSV